MRSSILFAFSNDILSGGDIRPYILEALASERL